VNTPTPDPTWTDIATVAILGGQLVLLLVAAAFAKRQLTEARELRAAQVRPFVMVDLGEAARPKIIDLVIKNIGTTIARDVTFEFDTPPKSSTGGAYFDSWKVLSEGISTLPPGREYRTVIDSAPARFASGLPDEYDVTVSYWGEPKVIRLWRRPKDREYTEKLKLDFGLYWNRMSVRAYGLHEIYQELERIRRQIEKWTANPGPGMLQVTPEDMEKRIEEIERQLEERRRQQRTD
jgi:hypothetical protein